MADAFICDAVRTPIGRYGGALARVRPDDMAAHVIATLTERNKNLDPAAIDDGIFGCANQAGEDNRNVARMAALLAGLPEQVPGVTVNRLCGSGLEAVGQAARAIRAGDASLIIAGGVESMTRAPFVFGKAESAFPRAADIHDTTLGWRFVNASMKKQYGIDSMPETGENVAEEFQVSRADQDAFALESQRRAGVAMTDGRFTGQIEPFAIRTRKGEIVFDADEHPKPATTAEDLARLRPAFKKDGTVTAGNAPGCNDGAAACVVVSETVVEELGLQPLARVLGYATGGREPEWVMMAPVESTRKLNAKLGFDMDAYDLIELNEAFAAQVIACHRDLEFDLEKTNVNGGSIALGHPIGATGTRIVVTLLHEMARSGSRTGLASLCVSGGMGMAMTFERT